MLSILFCDHLVFFPFFIFLIKGCEENLPVTIRVLEHQLCLKFMSPTPTVGSFLMAALTVPPALWIGDASKHQWSSCSYRKSPQGGSKSSCPTLVPYATRAFRKDGFLDSELECEVPEQTPKGLCLIASSPWSFTHPLQTHAYLGLPTCWGAQEVALSGRRFEVGTPAPALIDLESRLLFQSLRPDGRPSFCCTRDSCPSQRTPWPTVRPHSRAVMGSKAAQTPEMG